MEAAEFGKYLRNLRTLQKISIRQLALYSKVSNSYISQIENGKRNIPNPEILEKLAPYLKVPYNELMEKAGYIKPDNNEKTSNNQIDSHSALTRRDEREIEKILEQTKKQLENAEGLMFSGEPATPEAIQSILDSIRIGIEIAKQRNKEKYTPNKYKKKEDTK